MTALNIACIGEAMIELSLDADGTSAKVGFAGDTLNTAIYLRRDLPPEHEVAFVSVIGRDSLSGRMAEFIAAEGISTEYLARHPDKLPGIYAIDTDAAGERSFAYWRENSAARSLFDTGQGPSFDVLNDFDTIYLSAITLAILPEPVRVALLEWIAAFCERGGTFTFDSNYRPRLWPDRKTAQAATARAWQLCTIALPSVDDEMDLFGDTDEAAVLSRLRSYGIPTGALKRGGRGPVPIIGDPDPGLVFAAAERVVDTTAAGDSFVGAFLARFLLNADLSEAMMAGHNRAAEVIGFRGAVIPRTPE